MWARGSSHGSRLIILAFLPLALLLCCLSPAFCSEGEKDPAEMTDAEILQELSQLYGKQQTGREQAQARLGEALTTLEGSQEKLATLQTSLDGSRLTLEELQKKLGTLSASLEKTQLMISGPTNSLQSSIDAMGNQLRKERTRNDWLVAGLVLVAAAAIVVPLVTK
jgi:septal ring factor EnvC (AmiA/AmiB activator)